MGSIEEKIGLLNAHYETIIADIKCLQDYKKTVIEHGKDIKSLKETQKEFWESHDDFIIYKQTTDRNKRSINTLKKRLKQYEQIEKLYEQYDDLRITLIKHAIIIIILGVISGALGAFGYSYLF